MSKGSQSFMPFYVLFLLIHIKGYDFKLMGGEFLFNPFVSGFFMLISQF